MKTELLTTAQMAEADRLTIRSGVKGVALMEAAGRAVADRAGHLIRRRGGTKIEVLCGPGNNGGDGYVAAHALLEMGFDVEARTLGDPRALKGDAAWAFELWNRDASPLDLFDIEQADLVIDALFGAGLARDLDGAARDAGRARQRLAARARRLRAGRGRSLGPRRNDGRRARRGHRGRRDHDLLPPEARASAAARPRPVRPRRAVPTSASGRIVFCREIAPAAFHNMPALWRAALPIPRIDAHKYARGHAVVVSGGISSTGAARLAARGALRAGAGLVTLASPSDALIVNAIAATAIMVRRSDGPKGLAELLADPRKNAVALGPGLGLGEATCALVEMALAPARRPARRCSTPMR